MADPGATRQVRDQAGDGRVRRGLAGHKGQLRRADGQAVAIKLLKRPLDDELDPEAAAEYERENETLQQIRHPHLL